MSPADGGSEAGKIRATSNDIGLAHMRLKSGLEAASQGMALQSGQAQIIPQRPKWWPEVWGHEED